jgi:hypothetical protein
LALYYMIVRYSNAGASEQVLLKSEYLYEMNC